MDANGNFFDFTYYVDNESGLEEGNLPLDSVTIGYSGDDYVRDDYYTGNYTSVDTSVDSFGPTGSCMVYNGLENYDDNKGDSSYSDYYGEYLKVKAGTASTRKLYVDWHHTWGLADLDGASFSPLPVVSFSNESDKWVSEDGAFEDSFY